MAKIFISYRRDDSAGHAGRLYDHLVREYGSDQVFMDRVDIAPGEDFAQVIAREATGSDALLAIIGRRWLSATDDRGRRRLDDPRDVLRRELEAGLAQGGRTIPVLVDGADMPGEDALPSSLHGLLRHNALELSDSRWTYDLAQLMRVLGPIFGIPRQHPFEPRMLLIPAGPFLMGADPSVDPHADEIEQPQHRVELPDYYISKFPIRHGEYRAFLDESPYEAQQDRQSRLVHGMVRQARADAGAPQSSFPPGLLGRSAVTTYGRATSYCSWLSRKTGRLYRLPNEAEWEKAVRGTDGRIYPWGNRWLTEEEQTEGDRRRAGPFGLLDTVGAPEWVWTRREYIHEERAPEGLAERLRFWEKPTERRAVSNYPYDPRALTDAAWRKAHVGSSVLGGDHVRRGGTGWTPEAARCTAREFDRFPFMVQAGFRVALSRGQVRLPRAGI